MGARITPLNRSAIRSAASLGTCPQRIFVLHMKTVVPKLDWLWSDLAAWGRPSSWVSRAARCTSVASASSPCSPSLVERSEFLGRVVMIADVRAGAVPESDQKHRAHHAEQRCGRG
jgi:hypothetical protein